jgi:hypothetical protein
MRNEFYGDRKDLWKWTVVLNEAGQRRQVLYVAMYRPDGKLKYDEGIRTDVADFFRNERKALNLLRECSRIKLLSTRIIPFVEIYDPAQVDAYLAPVKQVLESRLNLSNYVVFLDPDTGIREKSGTEHACRRVLTSIWKSMLPGDTLLVYQHYARKKVDSWLIEKRDLISKTLQSAISDITCKQHSGVCFFLIEKKYHPCD